MPSAARILAIKAKQLRIADRRDNKKLKIKLKTTGTNLKYVLSKKGPQRPAHRITMAGFEMPEAPIKPVEEQPKSNWIAPIVEIEPVKMVEITKPSSDWVLPTPPIVSTWTVPDIFEIHREWWSKVVDMKLD